ncbi:MAG: 6-carboxytetrahydropterin synthase [Chitinophagales bacterium]
MIQVTKIFTFETAHAIHGYSGLCKNIHGHSYVLHVTVSTAQATESMLYEPPFVIDFKDLKKIVKQEIVDFFDHRLIISQDYLYAHPHLKDLENLTIWQFEPSVENILLYIRQKIEPLMPQDVVLKKMKLYETANSFAEWLP